MQTVAPLAEEGVGSDARFDDWLKRDEQYHDDLMRQAMQHLAEVKACSIFPVSDDAAGISVQSARKLQKRKADDMRKKKAKEEKAREER